MAHVSWWRSAPLRLANEVLVVSAEAGQGEAVLDGAGPAGTSHRPLSLGEPEALGQGAGQAHDLPRWHPLRRRAWLCSEATGERRRVRGGRGSGPRDTNAASRPSEGEGAAEAPASRPWSAAASRASRGSPHATAEARGQPRGAPRNGEGPAGPSARSEPGRPRRPGRDASVRGSLTRLRSWPQISSHIVTDSGDASSSSRRSRTRSWASTASSTASLADQNNACSRNVPQPKKTTR